MVIASISSFRHFDGSNADDQCRGSAVASCSATWDTEGKIKSISAMQVYENKSHEELMWEDYQQRNREQKRISLLRIQRVPLRHPSVLPRKNPRAWVNHSILFLCLYSDALEEVLPDEEVGQNDGTKRLEALMQQYTNRAKRKNIRWDVGLDGETIPKPCAPKRSPYTSEMKRRTFGDEMVPKLFQEAHPVKEEVFYKWISSPDADHELKLCGYTISDPKEFFIEAFNSRMWLDTTHVDLAMLLLRERQINYPISFGRFKRAILDSNFHELLRSDTTDDDFSGYVDGKALRHGKEWNDCSHVYYPVCTRKHWIAVEVVFSESTMLVYDCDPSVITTADLQEDLRSASVLIPKIANLAGITIEDTLKIVRVDGLPRQPVLGDCGVYTIKYIEFLSIDEPANRVHDRFMEIWRQKLTVDLFTQNYDP